MEGRNLEEAHSKGHSLTFKRQDGVGTLAKGTPITFVVPISLGIQLPQEGMCDRYATGSILMHATTHPPVAPASAHFYGGRVATTQVGAPLIS